MTTTRTTGPRLTVDWTACDGRGVCAELLPELVSRDDWGFPVLHAGTVSGQLEPYVRRALRYCPTMALRLREG